MRAALPSLLAAACLACNAGPVEQPIPFNHQLHVVKNTIQCETCHEHAADRAHAGLPRLAVCMSCHRRTTPKSAAGAAHVESMRKVAAQGADVIWARVYELPAHVYFSHQRHTEAGGLECKQCHGDLTAMAVPPARPIARTVSMDGCIACHKARRVSNDCAACHR